MLITVLELPIMHEDELQVICLHGMRNLIILGTILKTMKH